MNYAVLRIGVLVLLLSAGCQRQKPGKVLARVGDADLTLEEALPRSIPPVDHSAINSAVMSPIG